MKLFGSGADNTTSYATPDRDGNCYHASFEFYPFYEGKNHSVFKGMLSGRGRKRGHFCVVKTQLDHPGEEEDWTHYLETGITASQLAAHFNMQCCRGTARVTFTVPRLATIDELAGLSKIFRFFRRHEKKLRRGEHVVIEDFIDGPFRQFSSATGWAPAAAGSDILQAFSHFCWWHSRNLVICGLAGVRTGQSYELTTPVIHSLTRRFGPRDTGFTGIQEFFSTHRCNNICCHWPGLELADLEEEEEKHCSSVPPPYFDNLVSVSALPGYPNPSITSLPGYASASAPPATVPGYHDRALATVYDIYNKLGFSEAVSRL